MTLATTNGIAPFTWFATANGVTTTLTETAAQITVNPFFPTEYRVVDSRTTACNFATSFINVIGPLPVELISFDAAWNDKTPVLTWATATEKNSAYFDIERSFDGETFSVIGKREAAGNTSARTNYQFVDAGLVRTTATTVYYRLHQVDVSGEDSYSPVRALQVAAASTAFNASVFPNPYDKKVEVEFNSSVASEVTFIIRNVLGQTVLTKTASFAAGAQKVGLDEAGSLPLGMYYLTIRQGGQQQVLRISHR
ncbi:T9SS type A sorting domain-containing protein [Hymenobacter sp. B1770]|uniref:T9SS type A sorting domain-containing protein n=1 Tax=Hymenobacter sp. B1770 TaxID=1718788 RepID=UPI003CF743B3